MDDNIKIEKRYAVKGHERAVTSVRISPDCAVLASTGADKSIKLYNPDSGGVLSCIEGEHGAGVNDSAWLTNTHLVTACDDGMVRVWDMESNQLISTFSTLGIDRYPFSLAIHPRSRTITAGCTDGSLLTFHTHVKNPLHSSLAHGQCITSCSYSSMGDELLTSSGDGLVRQWVPAYNLLCLRSIVPSGVNVPVVRASYDPTFRYILSTTLDHTHRVHERRSASQEAHKSTHLSFYTGHVNMANNVWSAMAFVGRQMHVIGGGDDGKVSVWNLKSSKIIASQQCHEGAVFCGDWRAESANSSEYSVMYTGGADGGVAKWSVASSRDMIVE